MILLPSDPPYREPEPTRATRLPALRSRGSSRGAIVAGETARIYVYESSIERKVLTLLLSARPDVESVWEQPTPITFINFNGRPKDHTFDVLVTMKSSERVAVAVKPSAKVNWLRFERTMELVAGQLDRSFADRVVIVTELSFDPATVHDAELALFYSREKDAEADRKIDELTASLVGAIKVGDLMSVSGVGGRAFRAVVRLLATGKIKRITSGPIGPASLVVRVA